MKIFTLIITILFTPVRIVIFQSIWALNNFIVWDTLRKHPDLTDKFRAEIESRHLPWRLGL